MPSRSDLQLLIENRGMLLGQALEQARAGETAGGLFFDIAFHYRLLALAHLLLNGDAVRFGELLARSGFARLRYLRGVDRTADDEARFCCRSSDIGWEALLTAGHVESAVQLGRLLPDAWMDGVEYEEDFVYKRALHLLGDAGDADGATKVAALHAWLSAMDSDTAAGRAAIIGALLARDQNAYVKAMAALVAQRQDRFAELLTTPGFSKEHAITERHVFVLGLAIERIAAARGLAPVDLPMLPALARLPLASAPAAADCWLDWREP